MAIPENPDQHPSIATDPATAARQRVEQISELYEDIRLAIVESIAMQKAATLTTTKQSLAKMQELCAAHLLVFQAQERFHERHKQDDDGPGLDHEKLRDEISGALDRIRAASNPDSLRKGSDN